VPEPKFEFLQLQVTEIVDKGDHDEMIAVTPPVCDFCLDKRVRWLYPCSEFFIEQIGWDSADEWLVCDHCAQLIESGNGSGLLERVLESARERDDPVDEERLCGFLLIQHAFFAHRQGAREAFG
jgi:hypothetical protein